MKEDPRAHGLTEPVRVLRIIARLNVGGPAIQAISLSRALEARGYSTTLVRGVEGTREGNMNYLAEALGVRPALVPWLRRDLGFHDVRALIAVLRILRRTSPDILHTHAAKAGTIGRVAALLAGGRRPAVIVHTFHGHVLTDYFSPRKAAMFARIERLLARWTTCLVAVSEEVREDLIRLRIASRDRIEVVQLGFDLRPFQVPDSERQARRTKLRQRLGIAPDAPVVTLIARLVPIKRVDRFLRIAGLLGDIPGIRFLIVGDGELNADLRASAAAAKLDDQVIWAGFQEDIPAVCFASDVVTLTSDNEGTPVSLIEAQAAGVPVVATDVGGTASVVLDHQTGRLAPRGDDVAFARAVRELLGDPAGAKRLGAQGRDHVTVDFSHERLVADIVTLYRRLLGERAHV